MSTDTLRHSTDSVTVRSISVSDMHNNVYVITSRASGAQIVIDAADDADAVVALIDSAAADAAVPARVEWILTTHQHWDHVRALAAVGEATGAPLAAGEDDGPAIESAEGVRIERQLAQADRIDAGDLVLDCVHLRGHTPGSMAFVLTGHGLERPIVFSGDSLFPGGVGNTWEDPERFASLYEDVVSRLFEVYDDADVLPGHGDATTLADERPQLAGWRERGW
ncbi:MBL fold metallo-hydrolase [Zhihengliuella salsuginis]|uniref:Hydrolase n=1 Tax=Zhihengliuella salsuginis TaxID=578222 RepID=A0ABQ3GM96_9MICC|nr:MBL fold metallo-hydrolase [Zhihengliuella salsuginis]GHD13731.1 hydrolase [Zhihengliuella salsuginis]